jgi:hypothetical protein
MSHSSFRWFSAWLGRPESMCSAKSELPEAGSLEWPAN